MKCLIIIPSFNESENILNTVEDVLNNLDNRFSYIVINDCSTDNSYEVLKNNKINFINLPVNLGLSGAVQCGYKYAYENGYDAAIQFDGDGQHKACYIANMVEEIEKGANIVIGSRFINSKKSHSLRMIGSRIISLLIKLKTGKRILDPTSGMRMLDRKNIYDYAYNRNYHPEPDSLVTQIKKGNIVKEIPVEMNDRKFGKSTYSSPLASISYMIKMIISILFIS